MEHAGRRLDRRRCGYAEAGHQGAQREEGGTRTTPGPRIGVRHQEGPRKEEAKGVGSKGEDQACKCCGLQADPISYKETGVSTVSESQGRSWMRMGG